MFELNSLYEVLGKEVLEYDKRTGKVLALYHKYHENAKRSGEGLV